MKDILHGVNSPLFCGIKPEELKPMLSCIGYHIGTFRKGDVVAFEEENIRHIGIFITDIVDMIKEDPWGNKTMLVRMRKVEVVSKRTIREKLLAYLSIQALFPNTVIMASLLAAAGFLMQSCIAYNDT